MFGSWILESIVGILEHHLYVCDHWDDGHRGFWGVDMVRCSGLVDGTTSRLDLHNSHGGPRGLLFTALPVDRRRSNGGWPVD
ncbi:MAG: hypothetical protein ACYCVN_06050 [Acidimicrobiales bacterium]